MAAAQQGGGQGGDNTYAILWGIAAIFFIIGVVWFYFKKYIAIFFLTIKLYELSFLNWLSPTHFSDLYASVAYLLTSPGTITASDLWIAGQGVGEWLRIPFVIFLIIL